ncbi:MAG: SIR2 family protein [Anaerolineae bacterium]|nr:SIR2 family protein [Anaerolineae bacterium]
MFLRKKRTDNIQTVSELKHKLGDSFVILCGSAISATLAPHVPMVQSVEKAILNALAKKMEKGSRSEQLVGSYAKAMTNGKYLGLLNRTKFESFIWRLQQTIDKPRVDDLLYRVYRCTDKQYGPNHAAIAFLLHQRTCLACLTTNFDNAIELSCSEFALTVQDQNTPPLVLPTKSEPPLLFKLHGDAESHSCVAISPELSIGKFRKNYQNLQVLLDGRNVLVVGYSGTGDVDISLHLSNANAQFFWCNHSSLFPRIHPTQLNVFCNLRERLSSTAKTKNLLLALAASYGWEDSVEGYDHAWEDSVEAWINTVNRSELRDFVLSLMRWDTSWPHVHMAYCRGLEEGNTTESQLDIAESFAQIAAYRSARKQLTTLLQKAILPYKTELRVRVLLALVYWREGNFSLALTSLAPSLILAEPNQSQQDLAGLARIYLETIGEMMDYIHDVEDRMQLFLNSKSLTAIQIIKNSESSDEDNYLNRIAILAVHDAIGEEVKVTEIIDLFNECCSMENWPAASLTTQLILKMSFRDGLNAVTQVTPKLYQRHNYKLILKNFATLIHCALGKRFIFLFKLLNGRILIPIFTEYLEFTYRNRRRRWESQSTLGNQPIE